MDITINNVDFDDVDYISVPKKDGSGNAYFKNMEDLNSHHELGEYMTNTLYDINDESGQITGSIRGSAFSNSSNLQSVVLNGITYIGGSAFSSCTGLNYCMFEKCTSVGNSAFNYCGHLERIVLPSVSYFEEYAFRGNNQFELVLSGHVLATNYNGNLFSNGSVAKIRVPSDMVGLYKTHGAWANWKNNVGSIKQLDDNDAILYHISPQIINGTNFSPMIKCTTSKETVYGRDPYIVGSASDTITVQVTCPGYVTKNTTISVDGSTTELTLDVTDMQVDSNFNGKNIIYADLAKSYSCGGASSKISSEADQIFSKGFDINGRSFGNGIGMSFSCIFPNYTQFTNPTLVLEFITLLNGDDNNSCNTLYSIGGHDSGNGIIRIGKEAIRFMRSNGTYAQFENLNLLGEHHIGIVMNSSNIYLYIDGALVSTLSNGNAFNYVKNYSPLIGYNQRNSGEFFSGKLKQIALTARDIADPSSAQNCEFLLPIPQQA